jgi:hypothetical protein
VGPKEWVQIAKLLDKHRCAAALLKSLVCWHAIVSVTAALVGHTPPLEWHHCQSYQREQQTGSNNLPQPESRHHQQQPAPCFDALLLLSCRQSYDAFLVVHGTDTMAYTASALSLMLGGESP